ncbi:MAG: VTT domain-containing protein [Eubacterium sp.]|nr:VTT domain-containing protein [Eubacterium sp.]
MEKKGFSGFWKKHWKLFAYIGILAIAVLVIWFAFGDMIPQYMKLLHGGDEKEIERFISKEASWKGPISIIVLAALQVVSIVFPGFAIQIASGVIYGWFKSFLMCYVGFLLGNLLVFFFARRMGNQIAGFAPVKKNKNTWIREKLKTTKPEFVVAFVNLLPILPNGIIPYIAAGSSISTLNYFLAIALTSWIQIFFNCLAGGFIKHGQYLFMVLALGFQICVLIFVTLKRKWLMSLIPGGESSEEDEPDSREGLCRGKKAHHQVNENIK